MKYVIILYLCSFANVQPTCYSEKIIALEFTNYYDCILQGYKQSHNYLVTIDKDESPKEFIITKLLDLELILLSIKGYNTNPNKIIKGNLKKNQMGI